MIDVFITIDTEIWCDGWARLDERFPDAFRRCVYGPTASGDYGLPMIFRILREHGLLGTFFIEPLFSLRFGTAPLQEIVGLTERAGQEIQLHLHPEWVDEAREPLLDQRYPKRRWLFQYAPPEQVALIKAGLDCLRAAGAGPIAAFRAGSFAMGLDTPAAVAANGIPIDTSFDPTRRFPINSALQCVQPMPLGGVTEYPLSAFCDGRGRIRPAQVGACAFSELERLHWAAVDAGWTAVVILFHNFEMLTPSKTAPDRLVARRFDHLCRFLSRHRDVFQVRGFNGLDVKLPRRLPDVLRVGACPLARRWVEQAVRRVVYR